MGNRLTFKLVLLCCFYLTAGLLVSQEAIAKLPKSIDESSALICLPDGLFITLNDSGNDNVLFVVNKKGKLIHSCTIENAKNIDWEALAFDGNDRLFIGDIGNNKNKRDNLSIYEVSLAKVLEKEKTTAKKINFSYPDQTAFPPEKPELYFDAEGMVFYQDSIFIFTKNRTVPFDGVVKVYAIPTHGKNHIATRYPPILLPASSWLEDSVTDAYLDENKLFLLTYSKVYVFHWVNQNKWEKLDTIEFDGASQKEGICYKKGYIYITDEKSILGKQTLYRIPYKK